jgi:hypothetical protein
MFFAHDIAAWLGVPAGIVIAVMIIVRRRGMAAWNRHKQTRAAWPGSVQPAGPPGVVTDPHWGSR